MSLNWKIHEVKIGAVITLRGYEANGSCWAEADLKGGCVDLYIAQNVPFNSNYGWAGDERKHPSCDEYIHICDISDLIEDLKKIWEIQREIWNYWDL